MSPRAHLASLAVWLGLSWPALGATQRPTLPGDDPTARPGLLAPLADGRHINLRCAGSGATTVVLEGGFAATSLAWTKLVPLVTPRHRVCAYDRAGYGFSDGGPLPRDADAVAQDLDEALHVAGITGPYILVGHSAGALYVRRFADLKPHDILGMVLVDPSIPFQDRRLSAVLGPGSGSLAVARDRALQCQMAATQGRLPSTEPGLSSCSAGDISKLSPEAQVARTMEASRALTWSTQVAELDALWGASSEEVADGAKSYGDLPLVVLSATGAFAHAPEPMRAQIESLWL